MAATAEPARPESDPGVGMLQYVTNGFDGEDAFLPDGYTPVIEELAAPMLDAQAIDLETVVERVEWSSEPLIVHTNKGKYSAREVVCTFPLGVLKDNADNLFSPCLPSRHYDAIKSLGFGTLDKIFVVYSEPWWTNEPYASIIKTGLQTASPPPDMFTGLTPALSGISIGPDGSTSPDMYCLSALNLHALTDQPALAAFVSCKTATDVEAMTNAQAADLFHRTLTQWFGSDNEPPRPKAVHVTRWASDPFSKGSYSHMITGLSEPGHRGILQEPLSNERGGVLRFAGEHCSRDCFALTHGALLDGWRVADAILGQE